MIGDRPVRSRRRGLVPRKLFFVYCLTFLLITVHQAERVAEWLDDLGLAREGAVSENALKASAFIRENIVPLGPARLNAFEDNLLARTNYKIFSTLPAAGDHSAANTVVTPPPLPSRVPPADPDPADEPTEIIPSNRNAALKPPEATEPMLLWQAMNQPEAPPPPRTNAAGVFNPESVLLLGDSMMLEGMGPQLQRLLKNTEGLTVNRTGRYGTGLCRLDTFDWLGYFDETLDKYQPDLVILTLGANDPQDIVDTEKKRVFLGTDEWNEIYAGRVADLLQRAEARGVKVFWIGLPIMGRQPYGQRVSGINEVTAEACVAATNCSFWDSWLSMADSRGNYAAFLRDDKGKNHRVRSKDSIHLTEYGGRIMAEKFLAETADWVDYAQPEATDAPPPATVKIPGQDAAIAPSAGEGGEVSLENLITEYNFFSAARNKNTVFYLAAPQTESNEAGPFPVIILLHGAWDGAGIWLKQLTTKTLSALANQHKVILAMPDGEPFGWYLDGLQTPIETYLIKEFIPHLQSLPQVDPNRLAVTGLSMGGHGALTMTLKHPELFKAAAAMSGITNLAAHAGDGHPVNRQLNIDKVLGPAGDEGRNWASHSALTLTRQNPQILAAKPIMLSAGLDDTLTLDENRAYHQFLLDCSLPHVYREEPGAHDWNYWAAELPVQVEFLARALNEKE